MYEGYHKYIYEGPVYEFDTLIADRWKGETMAPTVRKAKSNLTYQFKRQNNRLATAKVILPGKVALVN